MNRKVFSLLFVLVAQYSMAQDASLPKKDSYERYLDSISAILSGKEFLPFHVNRKNTHITSNKDLVNKVVFVNFWFAECAPCMAEMKGLNQLYDSLKHYPDFEFLSITYEPDTILKKIINRYQIRYPVVQFDKAETKRLNYQNGYPTSFIVDRKNIIRYFKLGGDIDEDNASDDIMRLVYPKILSQLRKK